MRCLWACRSCHSEAARAPAVRAPRCCAPRASRTGLRRISKATSNARPVLFPTWPRSRPVAFVLDKTLGSRIQVELEFHATSPGEYRVQGVGPHDNVIRAIEPFRVTAAAAGPVSVTASLTAPILTDSGKQRVFRHFD